MDIPTAQPNPWYQPAQPSQSGQPSATDPQSAPLHSDQTALNQSASDQSAPAISQSAPPMPVVDSQQPMTASESYADVYTPPVPAAVSAPTPPLPTEGSTAAPLGGSFADSAVANETAEAMNAPATTSTPSEALADQNIFEMLGVTTGTPEQREQFLDELQQVIWEDFIEHDVKLLLTDEEQQQLQTVMKAAPEKSLEQQEQAVIFLEKLVPDLEEIMLEKALQLKEEMSRERLKALRELHRNDPEKLTAIDRAEQLMNGKQWRSAAQALNSVA